MLSGGDYGVNSMQICTDPLKEVLKQAMLKQEALFRRQVEELHRLYNLQKTLMEELNWKGLHSKTSWENTKSTQASSEDPSKHKPWTEEKSFPTLSTVHLAQTEVRDLLEGRQEINSSHHRRTLDLLPADDFISLVGKELPRKGEESCAPLFGSLEVKIFHFNDRISNPEEAELSLSTGMYTSNKECSSSTSQNKRINLSPENVIHLDEPIERVSKEVVKPPFSVNFEAQMTYIGQKCGLQNSNSSDSSISGQAGKDSNHSVITKSLEDYNEFFQERKSFTPDNGLSECYGSSPSVTPLTEERPSISPNKMNLYQNTFRLDEPMHFLNSPVVTFLSPAASSSGVLHVCSDKSQKETSTIATWWRNNICSNEISKLLKQDSATHLISNDSGDKSTDTQASSRSMNLKEHNGGNAGLIDLESPPVDRLGSSKSFGHSGMKSKEGYVSLGGKCSVIDNTSQMENSSITLNSQLADNHLFSTIGGRGLPQTAVDVKNGCVSCDKSEDAVSSSPCQLRLPFKEVHSFQNDQIVGASLYAHMQEKACNHDELQREVKERDDLVCGAAESLIQISLKKTEFSPNGIPSAGTEELANERREQEPSDSYEAIVLRMKESNLDDSCVTSFAVETEEPENNMKGTENKGTKLTLRRGRRLKDFQKDVLPGLVSLSRHEICEDMHSFGQIIKPKEFRRSRSMKASEENWWVPMRSRRSRLGNVPRRKFQ